MKYACNPKLGEKMKYKCSNQKINPQIKISLKYLNFLLYIDSHLQKRLSLPNEKSEANASPKINIKSELPKNKLARNWKIVLRKKSRTSRSRVKIFKESVIVHTKNRFDILYVCGQQL